MLQQNNIYSVQETNLHTNWKERKASAKKIGGHNGYDVVDCNGFFGQRIFYVVKNGVPLGYVNCYDYKEWLQITSTYFSPEWQGQGLGTMAYTAIIQSVHMLISDNDRTPAANALWAKLMRNPCLDVRDNGFDRFVATVKE